MLMPSAASVSSPAAQTLSPLLARAEQLPATVTMEATELARCLLSSLDHVGRGMLLVTSGARVLHANRLATQTLHAQHPLCLDQGRLLARSSEDAQRLADALTAALQRGLRHMLHLGLGEQRATVAVLPLDTGGGQTALVSLELPRRTQDLAVQCYARQHGLTGAETAVLEALLDGRTPGDIARDKQVAVSTVRTQIGQLRVKTGQRSIRKLLDRVGGLPPMMVVVQ
jgi:DNA-binding CsgD family transcriptional regulator